MSEFPQTEPADSAPRRRLWPWALLGTATGVLAVIIVLNIWNSRLTLTAERLAAARAAWERAGPRNYELLVDVSGSTQALYEIEVRRGRVLAAKLNGAPLERAEKAYPWTVPGLFEVVLQQDLDNDQQPGSPPAYTQAEFDPTDGHLLRYLRTSDRHRIQINVTLTVVP